MRKDHDNHDDDDNNNKIEHIKQRNYTLSPKTAAVGIKSYPWINILLFLYFLLVDHHHIFLVAAGSNHHGGEWWPLRCDDNSMSWRKANAFCYTNHLHRSASTLCMCQDHDVGWPVCKQQLRSSSHKSSFTLCDETLYAACLVTCGFSVDTVLCQKNRMLQCTVASL